MARTNRRDVLADGEIQVVHCINRCVRRAFLCGNDDVTGNNYDHRREMIRKRLEFLAGIMGIEVLGYAVMSNHFHTILRSRHDVVATWSDDQVALKWWMLCPARKNEDGSPAEPTEFELKSIRNDRKGLKEKRRRLSSISWFMRFLSERIAKEANKQDKCTGRFWEGRFKAQVLLDDAAILACQGSRVHSELYKCAGTRRRNLFSDQAPGPRPQTRSASSHRAANHHPHHNACSPPAPHLLNLRCPDRSSRPRAIFPAAGRREQGRGRGSDRPFRAHDIAAGFPPREAAGHLSSPPSAI